MAETIGEMLVKIGADISDLKAQMENAQSSMKGFEQNTTSIFGRIGETIKGALVFTGVYKGIDMLTSGIKGAISAGIDYNSNIQQNTIAFTQMLGSAQKAKSMLSDLANFAANTPFELEQVETGAKQLLAFGFSAQQVKPMLTSIGDAASGLGLGADGINRIVLALGQMKAHGTADGNDLLQLMQAGIPVWDILSAKIGKSTTEVQNMVSKGLLPSGQAIDMLMQGMEQKFPHMMDAQSKSFAGLMSTLSDNTKQVLGNIMKPAFDELANNIMPRLVNATSNFSNTLQSKGLGAAIASLIPKSVIDDWNKFITLIQPAIDGLKQLYNDVAPTFQKEFQKIADFFTKNAPEIIQAVENIISFVVKAFKGLVPILEPVVKGIVGTIKSAFDVVMDVIKLFADLFTGNWSKLWGDIKKLLGDALNGVLSLIKGVLGSIGNLLGVIGKAISDAFLALGKAALDWGKNIVEGLWNGISNMVGWIKDKVSGFAKSVGDTIKGFFGIHSPSKLMQDYGQYIAEGLALGIDLNKDKAVKSTQDMANAINDIVSKIQVVQTQMFNDAKVSAPGMNQSQLNIMGLMNSNIGNGKLVNALADSSMQSSVNAMIQDMYNQMAVGAGKNTSSDILMEQARANVNAILNGQKPQYGGDIHVNINAPVYGVNDLQKAIKDGVQQHVVPVLTNILQQPARAMGV